MSQLVACMEVSKQYVLGQTTVPVLDAVNLSIDTGDFIALMGPSGSGKTTLLNLIGGLDQPSSGAVEIDGENLSRMNQRQLTRWRAANVGFVFQFYHLLDMLDAQLNVELPLLLTNLRRRDRLHRARAALEIVDLQTHARHKPNQLSGGQQQRVAIARALVSDPKLLVCDEPTGDLDRQSADDVLALLQTLNQQFGKTILMVTHDPVAAGFAKTTLHMDKGRLASG